MAGNEFNQATRFEERNAKIVTAYLTTGATYDEVGEVFNMSGNNVKRIVQQVQRTMPKVDREDLADRLKHATAQMSRRMWDIAHKDAPPAFDQKGMALRDPETREVVRDYKTQIEATLAWLKVTERLSRLLGADAPERHEVDHSVTAATVEQAQGVVLRLENLRQAG